MENPSLQHELAFNVAGVAIDNVRLLIMLPEGLTYRKDSVRLNGAAIDDPSISSNVLSFRLAAAAADSRALIAFNTDAGSGARGALTVKAIASFDSPSQTAQSTAPIENVILRGEMLYESASYRFSPRFDVLNADIQPADRAQLDRIVAEWRGVTSLRLATVGHTDQTLIAARSRVAYPDNRALSLARAEAVAKYLAGGLDIDPARVTVEGRGADEPIATGHDAKSLALNRRVDIAIEGLRVVAAGGFTVTTPSARSVSVETTGYMEIGRASCRERV